MMRHLDAAVRPAIMAALIAVALRVSGIVTLANLDIVEFSWSLTYGFMPTITLKAHPVVVADLATKATVVMLAGTMLRVVPFVIKRGNGPTVLGRSVGVFVAIETLLLTGYYHLQRPPVVGGDALAIAVALSVAGVAVCALALWRAEWPKPLHLMVRTVASRPRGETVESAAVAAAAEPVEAPDTAPEAAPPAPVPVRVVSASSPATSPEPGDPSEDAAGGLLDEMQRIWPEETPEIVGDEEPIVGQPADLFALVPAAGPEEPAPAERARERDTADEAPAETADEDGRTSPAGETTADDESLDAPEPWAGQDLWTPDTPEIASDPGPITDETAAAEPTEVPTTDQAPPDDDPTKSVTAVGYPEDGLIDLNVADVDDLVVLPGIGPNLAGMIVTFRRFAGDYTSVDDLAAVAGIGPRTIERIRPRVLVGATAD